MKRSTITLAVMTAALPLAACGSSTEPANNTATVAATGNVMSADALGTKIRDLPEGQRRGVLFRAIRDAGPSGASCQSVTAMKEAAPVNGNPSWNAVCDNSTQWTIVLTADQSASVTGPGPVTIK
ncbi:hypothetical protein [Sphingomonas sp. SORGH_AS_0879]|uniref:hypothetical protein n=1 Tax=Sphingomonas sp. SORGH_AS_0879 TaxID=3041790 RepID=UPI00278815C8|nr:hypothetical protein [Sphingomonas sp. SORGH_AS_0879]MDQ1232411.1 hypothetical protein [Sphingomonas sp. SORGH_AS_0879]